MNQLKGKKHVVLLGAGHTNAGVLRMWRRHGIAGIRLTCVSNFPFATYSGMLPGVLASQYAQNDMRIDLARLCEMAGAHLVVAETTNIEPVTGTVTFRDQPTLHFDLLSIGIGSVPECSVAVSAGAAPLRVKPMQTFLTRLAARIQRVLGGRPQGPLRMAIVGAGAAGVELAFCLPRFVRRRYPDVLLETALVEAHERVVPDASPHFSHLVRKKLEQHCVAVRSTSRVQRLEECAIVFHDGQVMPADVVVWTTGAAAPELLARTGLPCDRRGFILTHDTLRSIADVPVFAVGDSGTIRDLPTVKAGVHAVRQTPVLWHNIHRFLAGRPLKTYRPQKQFLKLLNSGDGRALGEFRGLVFEGRWAWQLKRLIDGSFMRKFPRP